MSYLLIWFESLQKVAVNGELTVFLFVFWRSPVFGRKNRLNFGEDLFFGDHLILTEKPHQSNSRLIKIWVKFVYCCFKLFSSFYLLYVTDERKRLFSNAII